MLGKNLCAIIFIQEFGYLERRFINKGLKLVDFLFKHSLGAKHIQSKPFIRNPVLHQTIKRKESHLKGLKLL